MQPFLPFLFASWTYRHKPFRLLASERASKSPCWVMICRSVWSSMPTKEMMKNMKIHANEINEILSNINGFSLYNPSFSVTNVSMWLSHFHFAWCFSNFCPASVAHRVGVQDCLLTPTGFGFNQKNNRIYVPIILWNIEKRENILKSIRNIIYTYIYVLYTCINKYVAYVHDSHDFSQYFVRIVKSTLARKSRLRLWIGCSFCCFRQVPSVMRSISSSMSAELSSAKDSSASSWHIQVQVPQESAISSIACRKVWYVLLVFFSYFHGPPSVNAFWQEVQVWSVG